MSGIRTASPESNSNRETAGDSDQKGSLTRRNVLRRAAPRDTTTRPQLQIGMKINGAVAEDHPLKIVVKVSNLKITLTPDAVLPVVRNLQVVNPARST